MRTLLSRGGAGIVVGVLLGLAGRLPAAQAGAGASPDAGLPEPAPLALPVLDLVRTNSGLSLSQRMAVVTNAPIAPSDKVQALLLILRGEAREGQRKVAHVVMRHADTNSFVLVHRFLLEPGWHPQVHSVFMTGTLKQKDSIRLPLLLALARTEKHPLREEAHQVLVHLLKRDHGENWTAWQTAVTSWIRSRPD